MTAATVNEEADRLYERYQKNTLCTGFDREELRIWYDGYYIASGKRVTADIEQFAAVSVEISSREQIYSAMVIYGLLTYRCGEVLIPNKELMDQFERTVSFLS